MNQDVLIRWLIGGGIALLLAILGVWARGLVAGRLARWMRKSPSLWDDLVIGAVSKQIPFWFLLLGIEVGVHFSLRDAGIKANVDRFIVAVLLFTMARLASSLVTGFIAARASTWPGGLPVTTLSQNVVRLSILGIGLLVALGHLGIEIAPLLAALGVGSLAIALALQPTLSNLFAGFLITLARRIRVGDFIELEGGQQGEVADIGWRSTQLRELSNNLVVVPNAKLAEVIVRNHSLPESEQAALVQVGVSYDSDLDHVEKTTLEAARQIQHEVSGAIPMFEPFIRYHTLSDSSIDFTVILRVQTFVDRYLVTHEFIKLLHRRYREAGIEIPFPQSVVHLRSGLRREV